MKINEQNGIIKFLEYTNIKDNLEPGNYNLLYDHRACEYYLTKKEDFILPSKIYGDTEIIADRYINTFKEKTKTLGILLVGEKGSGKTLLGQLVCKKSKLPVLFITEPYTGPQFNDFIANIDQECIIFFDEFEKIYSYEDQKSLLTVLDGNFSNKKMFILTSNDEYINPYMNNRPGRIYYKKIYDGLSEEEIREVAKYELKDSRRIDDLLRVCNAISKVNMDLVRGIIEESNRYQESPLEVIKYLNIGYEKRNYEILLVNKTTNEEVFVGECYDHNPFIEDCDITYRPEEQDRDSIRIYLHPRNIVTTGNNIIVFKEIHSEENNITYKPICRVKKEKSFHKQAF